MLIKVNKPFLGLDKNKFQEGKILEIKDNQGIPIDPFWRARLKDSKKDKCISIVEKKEVNKKDK